MQEIVIKKNKQLGYAGERIWKKESAEKEHPAAKKNWKWKASFTFRAAMLNFAPFLETENSAQRDISA